MTSIPEFINVCHPGLGIHGGTELVCISRPGETSGNLWSIRDGEKKLRGLGLNFLAGRGRERDRVRGWRRRSWKGSRAPKIPAGIPELVSRSFSGVPNGKQQPGMKRRLRAGTIPSYCSGKSRLPEVSLEAGEEQLEFSWRGG